MGGNILNFAKNLKELMEKNNVKNSELAKALNIDKSNITYYLKGEKYPNYKTLEKIINFFGCSYDDLLK